MTFEQAKRICGNQSSFFLRMMVKALLIHQWCNNKEDWERLAAAKLILKSRSKDGKTELRK